MQAWYSQKPVTPPPIWTRVFRNIWSRTFYAAPLAMPLLTLVVLWLLRPQELDTRAILLCWLWAVPVGFFIWIAAWKIYGAGTGQVSLAVAITALLGWCAWHRGLYLAFVNRRTIAGIALSAVSLLTMYAIRENIGSGTGPIKLATMASITGAIFLLFCWVGANARTGWRFIQKKFAMPAWKFLNQPVAFRSET